MPNTIPVAGKAKQRVTHDPTATLDGNPLVVIGSNPYGDMTTAIIFGAVNQLLGWIDDATGLDLLGMVTPLEEMLGGATTNLLSGLLIFIQVIHDAVQAIVDAVNEIPTTVTGFASDVSTAITKLLGIGNHAQNTASLALSLVLGGVSGGVGTSGSDSFDGSTLTDAGTNYDETTWGSASNKYHRDGTGKLRFGTGGIVGNDVVVCRNDIAFMGDTCTTGIYLPTNVPGSGARLILLNRFSATDFGGYCVLVSSNSIRFGYITTTGGTTTIHTLGLSSSYVQTTGEYWEFDVGDVDSSGTVTNAYMLRVRRNGTELASYDDSAAMNVVPDPGYRDIAFGGESVSNISGVIPAPTIDIFTWFERA